MIERAMPNSHLVLHKETLKQHLENKTSIKHLIKIINLEVINWENEFDSRKLIRC